MHSGKPERLFLHPGSWHRRGRWLRTQCEILVEEVADARPRLPSQMLLWICRGIGGAGLAITGMILTSVSVQLWLEPLLAFNFNRMSWISPLANLVMVPFLFDRSGHGYCRDIHSESAPGGTGGAFARRVACIASLRLRRLHHDDSRRLAAMPDSRTGLGSGRHPSALGLELFRMAQVLDPLRLYRLAACICILQLGAAFGRCIGYADMRSATRMRPHGRECIGPRFTFLDVGEGDSIVIRFPGGRMAPGCRRTPHCSLIRRERLCIRHWRSRREPVFVARMDSAVGQAELILSHADQDHAGGIPAVMKNFRVMELAHAKDRPNAVLDGTLKIAVDRRVPAVLMHAGMQEQVGMVSVRVLHPRFDHALVSSNENSIVLHISYGHFSALLMGDLEKAGERELLGQPGDLTSSLLKVAHHGSRSGTSHALLDRVQPRWAVVSVGRDNPFGHPSPEVMARLRRHKVRVTVSHSGRRCDHL